MKDLSIFRLWVILLTTSMVILALESRPSPVAYLEREYLLSERLLLAENRLDSLRYLLEEERSATDLVIASMEIGEQEEVKEQMFPSPDRGQDIAEDVKAFANRSVLVGDDEYERYLKSKLPLASFISTSKHEEYKARIEAMRQMAVADRQLRQGNLSLGLDQLLLLKNDSRLTKEQQKLAGRLSKR